MLRSWLPAALLVVGAIWCVLPMWEYPWWHSDENIWYPIRLHEYLEVWDANSWYPRWCPSFHGGHGYPFLHYYAPGVYFGGAVLSQLGLEPFAALKLLMLLVTVAGSLGVYGLVLGETRRSDAALVGGALYVFLPYRCTDLFTRGDLAEYSAYCLVPFVFWAYRAIGRNEGRRRTLAACAAALVHAGVLMTHTLVGMFTTELVGIYLALQLWRSPTRRQSLVGIAAMSCGIAIAAVYVVPAFFERDLVHLERISHGRFTPWRNMVKLRDLDEPFFTPGLPFAAAAGAWLAALAIPATRSAARRSAGWWLASIALLAIMMTWFRHIWLVLPFGDEVQFPWRLLGYVGLFAAVGLGMLWTHAVTVRRRSLAIAIGLALAMPWFVTAQRKVVPEGPIPLEPAGIRAVNGTSTAMNEYLPKQVERIPERPRESILYAVDPGATATATERDALHFDIAIETTRAASITLAQFAFEGWRIETLDGPADAELRVRSPHGFLEVHVPAAGRYRITVGFGRTPLWTFAGLLSLVALLALYPLLARLGRWA